MTAMLTIALTKGRILKETLPLLEEADLYPIEDVFTSRKLIFASNHPNVQFIILRGADVTTYVRHGVADIGVAGKDMLMEYGGDNLYELLDLKISQCRLMTAAVKGSSLDGSRCFVASKFVNIARRHYASKGLNAELIKLYGAMELAPIVGLADEIVDIVDTGNTLLANGLEPRELIAHISSRLIVNRASMKTKYDAIQSLYEKLKAATERRDGA